MEAGQVRVRSSNVIVTVTRVALALIFSVVSFVAAETSSQSAQKPEPGPKSGAVVLGRVTDGVRGSGVAEATVRLRPRQGGVTLAVITDPRGQFAFFNVAEGSYELEASKPGYWFGTYGQTDPRERGREFIITGGRAPFPTTVPVWRGGELGGTVIDEAGAPAQGWTVHLLGGFVRGGRLRWSTQPQQAVTDDRGAYRLGSIYPGTYVLMLKPPRSVIESSGKKMTYRAVAYPSAQSLASASPIEVQSGTVLSGLNASMQPLEAFSVSGSVNGPTGSQATIRLSVWNDDAMNELEVTVANTTRTGDFRFDGVPAGTYRVSVWAAGAPRANFAAVDSAGNTLPAPTLPTRPADAFARTVVGKGDVSNVALTLPPQLALTGRVVFRGEAQPAPQVLRGIVVVTSSPDGSSFGSSVPDTSGSFSTAVIPGAYFVRPLVAPPGWTIESITASGQSALDSPVTVEGQSADVVITLTDRLSEVSGRVRASDGGPLPTEREASVFFFPIDRALWLDNGANPLRLRAVRVTPDGGFVTRGLLPGEYFAVAAATTDFGSQWQLATALERLSKTATRVRVAPTDKVALELRLGTGR